MAPGWRRSSTRERARRATASPRLRRASQARATRSCWCSAVRTWIAPERASRTSTATRRCLRFTPAGHGRGGDRRERECRQEQSRRRLVTWIGSAATTASPAILLKRGAPTRTRPTRCTTPSKARRYRDRSAISNPEARETFRHVSVIAAACVAKVAGFGPDSYRTALEALLRRLRG